MCFDFLYNFCWNISHSEKKWARYDKKICIGFHVKHPLLTSDFNDTWIFSTDFRKILKYKILWKSLRWQPSCSMRTNGRKESVCSELVTPVTSSEHTRPYTNKRPANLNQPPIQYIQREVRQYTDKHIP